MKPGPHLRCIMEYPEFARDDGLLGYGKQFIVGQHLYSGLERAMLLEKYAEVTNVGYEHALDAMLAQSLHPYNHQYRENRIAAALGHSRTAIIDGIYCDVGKSVENMKDTDYTALAEIVKQIGQLSCENPEKLARRIILPLSLEAKSGAENGHAVTATIEWDPAQRHFFVSLFEQHARDDGTDRDFRHELTQLQRIIRRTLEHANEAARVETGANALPYCQEKNVCGIVGLETARFLASSDQPPRHYLTDSKLLEVDQPMIEHLHAQNLQLILREPTTPGEGRGRGGGKQKRAQVGDRAKDGPEDAG